MPRNDERGTFCSSEGDQKWLFILSGYLLIDYLLTLTAMESAAKVVYPR